jgi:hypothetical protein
MGEPKAGQIPDNIFLSVQQIKVKGDVVASKGDWLIRSGTPAEFWELADATSDGVDLGARGLVQTRVDIDTTGLVDGAVSVEVLAAPSYVYALAGAATVIVAGGLVKLFTDGQSFMPAIAADLAAGFVVGRMSRLAVDQAGNRDTVGGDLFILKMGVN